MAWSLLGKVRILHRGAPPRQLPAGLPSASSLAHHGSPLDCSRFLHALYRLRTVLCALALLSGHVSANALHTAPAVPAQVSNAAWEEDMQRFAESDARQPPPKYGIVFVGSSSIRFWETLAQDFPGKPVINRGFGGSEVRDSTWYADRIVIPYAPRQVVLYAGDNDLNSGRTPGQVRDDVLASVARIRRDLPDARISYVSIKPSPSRAQLLL